MVETAKTPTPLARFAATHEIRPHQLAEATGKTLAHACYLLSGERQPSKEVIDSVLSFCRKYDPKVTYEDLFGNGAAA